MRVASGIAAIAAVIGLVGVACWIRSDGRPRARASDHINAGSTLSLLLVGAQDGEIGPCGCAQPQLGGVERLAALVDELRNRGTAPVLVQLGGDTTRGAGELDAMKARLLEDCLHIVGAHALFSDGTGTDVPDTSGVWSRSVALVDAMSSGAGGTLWTDGRFDVERGGLRLRIESWTTRPPFDEITVGASRPRDGVYLFAADGAAALAAARARIVAAGRGFLVDLGEYVTPGRQVEGRLNGLVELGLPARGKACGKLDLRVGSDGLTFRYQVVELGPDLDSRESGCIAAIRQRMGEFWTEVERADLVRRTTIAPERLDDTGFVGVSACRTCHRTQAAQWDASPHSHALQTLAARRRSRDPDCLPCHTTGWVRSAAGSWMRSATGFSGPRASAPLAAVECEACHGPGKQHAEAARRGSPAEATTRPVAIKTCALCHDAVTSPRFPEASVQYWNRVRH